MAPVAQCDPTDLWVTGAQCTALWLTCFFGSRLLSPRLLPVAYAGLRKKRMHTYLSLIHI